MSESPVIALSEGLQIDDVAQQVNAVISQTVKTVAAESFSRGEIAELAHDMLKDYKGGVEKMEAVLQHTAVVDEYLGADAKKIPAAVPVGLVAWLRRAWSCLRPIVASCRTAAAVSVVVAQKTVDGVVGEEPDAETLSRDTRLVVDEKAPQASPAPNDQPTPGPQEENTQPPPADNTAPTEATHQASAEQS
jgi:hypothetical protein